MLNEENTIGDWILIMIMIKKFLLKELRLVRKKENVL